MERIELDEFVSVAEAAKILGLSRQAVHSRINRGWYEKVYYVVGDNGKPYYLLDKNSVDSPKFEG